MDDLSMTGGGRAGPSALEIINTWRASQGLPQMTPEAFADYTVGKPGIDFDPDHPDWTPDHLFAERTAVLHRGTSWRALRPTQGEEPGVVADAWTVLAQGGDAETIEAAVQAATEAGAEQVALAAEQVGVSVGLTASALTSAQLAAQDRAAAEQAALTLGATAYPLRADLPVSPESGARAYVYADGNAANIGLWFWSGASWVRDQLNPAKQSDLAGKQDVRRARGRLWGVLGANSRLGIWLDLAADLWVRGDNLSAKSRRTVIDTRRTGYAWGVIDAASRLALGLTTAGRLIYRGRDVSDMLDGTVIADVAELRSDVDGLTSQLTSTADIICWGDSLTEGAGSTGGQTYPAQLATLTGRNVINRGRGSQAAEQIAARAGGRASLLTVSGNEIPASGAVNVTARSIDLLFYAGASLSITGWLAGVYGTLTKVTASGGGSTLVSYTFTRATTGSAVRCLPGTAFIPDQTAPGRLHIVWLGRNDYSGVTDAGALAEVNARIRASADSIIATMTALDRRVILLGVTSRDQAIEYVGTPNYDAKRALAAELARDYPRSFIDIDAILRASGDGSSEDNAAIANGVLPVSVTAGDRIHLNNHGYSIVAAEIAARLSQNGW